MKSKNKIELMAKTPIRFKQFKINDEALKNKSKKEYVLEVDNGTIMSYFISEENELIDLIFIVDQYEQFDMDIFEAKFDLFTNDQFEITLPTKKMIPTPFVLNDATVVKTNIKFSKMKQVFVLLFMSCLILSCKQEKNSQKETKNEDEKIYP